MFSIQVFADTETEITSFVDDRTGVVWFHAGHIGEVLDFTTPSRYLPTVLQSHEFKEVKTGVGRPSLFVREEGVYMLIMDSKSPYASNFKHWLAYDVLPAIRKTGHFGNVPNHESEASEFWQLIDGAIARGLEPERAIDLRRQYEGKAAATPPNVRKVQVSRTRLVAVPDLQKFCRDVGLIESKGSEIGVTELWSLLQKWQVQNDVVLVRNAADLFLLISIEFPSIERTKHPKTRRSLLRNLAIA